MSKASSISGSLSQMICDGIHVSNICTKANRTHGFLRRNLCYYPQEVKEGAYKGLLRPVLEDSGSVWDPSDVGLQNDETGSMTVILEHLKWESLKKRRRDSSV